MWTTLASRVRERDRIDEVRELRRLLDGAHGAHEPDASRDGEDPAQPSRGLAWWKCGELGHGRLDRGDLAEVDEARQRADRARQEGRSRAW